MPAPSERLGHERLLSAFSSGTAVVFCGAGISLEPPAGLPDWNLMRDMTLESVISEDSFLRRFLPKLTEIPMLADPDGRHKGMTNEVVASTVAENAAHYFDCFESLKVGQPNANHLCLARMARSGHIHTIVTTNWDLFIERAMDELGVAYEAVRTEDEFARFQPQAGGDRVRILKLHGCLSKPAETIVATVEQEARGLWPVKQRALEGLLGEYLLVFWGYSGLDLKIDPDYLRMRSSIDRAKGFVWDAYHEPTQYVRDLADAYGERGTLVRRALPGVLDRLIALPERVTLSDEEWDRWQQAKNAQLGESLRAWARDNVGVFGAYLIVGSLLTYNGDHADALACYQHMAEVAGAAPDARAWCLATGRAGAELKSLGRNVEAMNAYQEALDGFRRLGDDSNVHYALNRVAALYTLLGRYDRALTHYKEAEQIARQHDWNDRLGSVFEGVGELYKNWGKAERALTYYERALSALVALGDRYAEARVLEKVGVLYRNWGESTEALSCFHKAEGIYRSLGMRAGLAYALRNIGSVTMLQQPDAAEPYLREASELAHLAGEKSLLSSIYSDQAFLAAEQGRADDARSFAERAVELTRELGLQRDLAIALNNLATWAPESGVAYRVEALELLEQIHDRQTAANTSELIGDHYQTQDDPEVAQSYYERAMAHYNNAELYAHLPGILHKIDLCRTAITGAPPQSLHVILGAGMDIEPAWETVLASACTSLLQDQERDAAVDWQEGLRRVEQRYGREEAAYRIMRAIAEQCQQLIADDHVQAAVRCYQIAAQAAAKVGYLHLTGVLYNEAGLALRRWGDSHAALEYFIQAERLTRAINDEVELITRLINLAATYQALDQPQDALRHYAEAEQIARRINDTARLCRILAALGEYYKEERSYELALPYLVEAEALAQELGDAERLIQIEQGLGKIYREQGDFERSMAALFELAKAVEAAGELETLEQAHYQIGELYEGQQAWDQALEHYRLAERAARDAGYRLGVGFDLFRIGLMYQRLGRYEEALEAYQGAREIHQDNPNRSRLGNVLLMMGDTHAALGDLQSAVAVVDEALRVAVEARSRQGMLACLQWFVALYEHLGAAEQAEHYRQLAAQVAQSGR